MYKKIIKKSFLLIFIICEIFLLNVPFANAFLFGSVFSGPDIPSSGEIMDDVENRYQINADSVREMTATMNVAPHKGSGPEVQVQYSTANPKLGDEMFASAMPMWFKNSNESLYYTWYIEHDNGEPESTIYHAGYTKRTVNGNTDWNADGNIGLEDFKIEAARIIAQGEWEPDLDWDKNGVIDGSDPRNADEWYQKVYNTPTSQNGAGGSWDWDKDEDGYVAYQGGDGLRGDAGDDKAHCYIQDFKGGRVYEITEMEADDNDSDFGACGADEVVCATTRTSSAPSEWEIQPLGTEYDDDDATTTGTNIFGGSQLNPNGDVPGVGMTYSQGPVCVATRSSNHNTAKWLKPYCLNGAPACYSGVPVCGYEKIIANGVLVSWGDAGWESKACAPLGGTEQWAKYFTVASSCSGSSGFRHCVINGLFEYNHIFPQPRLHDRDYNLDAASPFPNTTDTFRVGFTNNGFKLRQERFWGTNPYNSDTSRNGFNDEQSVIGLGQNKFSWTYQPGDKVGVAVEGTSLAATKYDDGSNMTMWAVLHNSCDPWAPSSLVRDIKGRAVTIYTAAKDINSCLDNNYASPAKGEGGKLDIEVAISPEFPINDPSDEDEAGDILFAQAILSNSAKQDSEMLFSWEVSMCDPPTGSPTYTCGGDSNWVSVVGELQNRELLSGGTRGNGISELKIALNMKQSEFANYGQYFPGDDIGYMKIRVRVRELAEAGQTFNNTGIKYSNEGVGEAIVKILSSGNKLTVWKVGNTGPVNSPNLVFEDGDPVASGDNPICDEIDSPGAGGYVSGDTYNNKAICRVVKNEVIGVEYEATDMSNFYWTLDGKPLICSNYISSSKCSDDVQTKSNFFPITKNPGESFLLGLSATKVSTGNKINLVRRFEVVDPFIEIEPESGAETKLMGVYCDLQGSATCEAAAGIVDPSSSPNLFGDFSEMVFETNPGNSVNLLAVFHPGWIYSAGMPMEWIVNGLPNGDTGKTTSVTIDKDVGGAYDVEFNAKYNKDPNLRRAMLEIWGISQYDSEDKYLTAVAKMEVIDDRVITLRERPGKILASMAASFPGQIIFLLRIILTIFLVLFISGTILSFTSKPANK